MAIDPICGMTVDKSTSLHAERDGQVFNFCCEHCRSKFPVFVLAMAHLLLTGPVVFGAGWPLLKHGWRSLMTGHRNMFTLIAMGVGVGAPCALGLATPMSIMVGIGRGAQEGILVKSAESRELLENVVSTLLTALSLKVSVR